MRLSINCVIEFAQGHRLTYQEDLALPNLALGISGVSGCGKTTLLRILAGLETRAKGQVWLDDTCLQDSAAKVFVQPEYRQFGYVFQESRLFPHLSVEQNLNFGLMRATKPRFDRKEVIDCMSLSPLLNRRTQALSGGEKQRVAIARAILSSPRLLLLDEPLVALDDDSKTTLLGYLNKVKTAFSLPMICVSHHKAELAALCEKTLILTDHRCK